MSAEESGQTMDAVNEAWPVLVSSQEVQHVQVPQQVIGIAFLRLNLEDTWSGSCCWLRLRLFSAIAYFLRLSISLGEDRKKSK